MKKDDQKEEKFSIVEPGEPSLGDLEAQVFQSAAKVVPRIPIVEHDESSESSDSSETTKASWTLPLVIGILVCVLCIGVSILVFTSFSPQPENIPDIVEPDYDTQEVRENPDILESEEDSWGTESIDSSGRMSESVDSSGRVSDSADLYIDGDSSVERSRDRYDSDSDGYYSRDSDPKYSSDELQDAEKRNAAMFARRNFWVGAPTLAACAAGLYGIQKGRETAINAIQAQENDPNFIDNMKAKLAEVNMEINEESEYVIAPVKVTRSMGYRYYYSYSTLSKRKIAFEDLDQYEFIPGGENAPGGGYLRRVGSSLGGLTFFMVIVSIIAAAGLAFLVGWLFYCRKFQNQAGTGNCTETVFWCKKCRHDA